MKNIKIIVATHKSYEMPSSNLYLPLQVGSQSENKTNYTKDNTGENISLKNPYYCELTGLYWAWKNRNEEYLGLCHYRRYFKGNLKFYINGKAKKILSEKEIQKYLDKTDIILPKKRHYYIETLYSHYNHTMYIEPLNITGEIINDSYPQYYKEFENLKKRRSAHMFNMFIMKKEILNEYSTWLFDILSKLEERVDANQYDNFHARFYGRISELLLDVWINTKRLSYKEIGVINIEKINYYKKGMSFLKAKFGHKKYGKSF